jgi:hypothetical protein
VKIAKLLIKKANESKQDIYKCLLVWRNTPNEIGSSPNQRLIARRTRRDIPMTSVKLKPEIQGNVPENIERRRRNTKMLYGRKSTSWPKLIVSQPIFVKQRGPESERSKGVVKKTYDDRSYGVVVNSQQYRRNRRHINPVPPIATDETIGPEQINGSVPVNESDTMQAIPTVLSTSVEAKKTPTIFTEKIATEE